eukprot:CAMPEP_0196577104 /NCGR_PEP_ID=MMETSP1081-20130531/6227_1 /TAXON_ID=36882 /ORGANISM="Pyramimonas amylifera, Strain CCMP720" /LENGTH=296 /DNA_ID=CAMNT_0041895921 /DNA_START=59 /DNA_END=949 /DNA_ORIENTATION=+
MHNNEEELAAVEIQRLYRGHKARGQIANERMQTRRRDLETTAATTIQARYKGHMQRDIFKHDIEFHRHLKKEQEASNKLKGKWLGYLTRKQLKKLRVEHEQELLAVKQAAVASLLTEYERTTSRPRTREDLYRPSTIVAQELLNDCQYAQSIALSYISKEGWAGLTPTDEVESYVAAKWRARRHVLALTAPEVADLLANASGLPQYRQVFESAFIHGKRLMTLDAPSLSQLGIRQHDHRKIFFSAITEIQRYCDDMEYVPSDQLYPDVVEDNMKKSAKLALLKEEKAKEALPAIEC